MKQDPQRRRRFETRAIHAGQEPDPRNGAVMTPVYFTTTFEQDAPAEPREGYEYSRTTNPTRRALEENLASLEGGRFGLAFASGMAAINALCDRLRPGDRVVAGNDLYGGTHRLFTKLFRHYGVEFRFVDASDTEAVSQALGPKTRYLYLESPTNPLLSICDVAACAELARKAGAVTVVDNTFATPFLQRPLELGADLVLHSLSKYVGGHSDAIGGALVVNDATLHEELAFYQNAAGGQLGPMDAFLFLRGAKTLALRMERHCRNARAVAEHLSRDPRVEKVLYPGLPSHPGHETAARQMSDFGGMVSFELAGGLDAAKTFSCATEIFTLAESLGGVESLVEVPPLMTHASIPADERRAAGLADGLIRLSVGIEHEADLIEDLDAALARSDAVAART